MGDMTVAYPTAGIASPQLPATSPACSTCGTLAVTPGEPFCARCGSRVALPAKRGYASIAATRALRLTAVAVLANVLVGGTSFGVVYLLSDAARLTQAALGLEALRLIIVGTLLALAIVAGIRGLRETRDGMLRRRAWAIIAIVVSSGYALLIATSFAATVWLALR